MHKAFAWGFDARINFFLVQCINFLGAETLSSSLGDQSHTNITTNENILVFVYGIQRYIQLCHSRSSENHSFPAAHWFYSFCTHLSSKAHSSFCTSSDTMINKVSDCVYKIILSICFISTRKAIVAIQTLVLSLTCKVFWFPRKITHTHTQTHHSLCL